MIGLAVASAAVLIFAILLVITRIGQVAGRAVSLSVEGVSVIFDRELDEDEKEVRVRRAALSLFAVAGGRACRLG